MSPAPPLSKPLSSPSQAVHITACPAYNCPAPAVVPGAPALTFPGSFSEQSAPSLAVVQFAGQPQATK